MSKIKEIDFDDAFNMPLRSDRRKPVPEYPNKRKDETWDEYFKRLDKIDEEK